MIRVIIFSLMCFLLSGCTISSIEDFWSCNHSTLIVVNKGNDELRVELSNGVKVVADPGERKVVRMGIGEIELRDKRNGENRVVKMEGCKYYKYVRP